MPSEHAVPSGVPKCSAKQSLVVNAMAGFVEHAKKRLVEEARIVPRRDAAIARTDARTKRMRGDVEPARLEVEADRLRGGSGECVPGHRPDIHARAHRARGFRFDWPIAAISGTRSADRAANTSRISSRSGAWLVFVEQCIVGVILVSDRVGFAAFQRDDLFEPGFEGPEIIIRPRFLPDLLRTGCDSGDLLDQVLGQLYRSIVAATNFAHVDRLWRCPILHQRRRLDDRQTFADFGIGGHLVRQSSNEGHLIAPEHGAVVRHVGVLVPAWRSRRTNQGQRPPWSVVSVRHRRFPLSSLAPTIVADCLWIRLV